MLRFFDRLTPEARKVTLQENVGWRSRGLTRDGVHGVQEDPGTPDPLGLRGTERICEVSFL